MTMLRFVAALSLVGASLPLAAQTPAQRTPAAQTVQRATPKMLSGKCGNALSTIQGNALSSTNGQLADQIVRLRDARSGRIVGLQTTDKAGLFAFKGVEPGSYIVELMAQDQSTVLTASQILNVNACDAISAIVKLPFRIPPFAGVMGHSTTSSVAAITAQAATSGIVAMTPLGDVTCPIQ